MGYWDDMKAALEAYPVEDVTLEVVDVDFATGTVLNVSEEATLSGSTTTGRSISPTSRCGSRR
jgi:hypothetical protein